MYLVNNNVYNNDDIFKFGLNLLFQAESEPFQGQTIHLTKKGKITVKVVFF
jgi:hypothetical protein